MSCGFSLQVFLQLSTLSNQNCAHVFYDSAKVYNWHAGNKNNFKNSWGWNVPKFKNNEPRPKFAGSYKKCVYTSYEPLFLKWDHQHTNFRLRPVGMPNIPREIRVCRFFSRNDIGNEDHYCMVCPHYEFLQARNQFLQTVYHALISNNLIRSLFFCICYVWQISPLVILFHKQNYKF